jgi:hypothetical protein
MVTMPLDSARKLPQTENSQTIKLLLQFIVDVHELQHWHRFLRNEKDRE